MRFVCGWMCGISSASLGPLAAGAVASFDAARLRFARLIRRTVRRYPMIFALDRSLEKGGVPC